MIRITVWKQRSQIPVTTRTKTRVLVGTLKLLGIQTAQRNSISTVPVRTTPIVGRRVLNGLRLRPNVLTTSGCS
jgi:hypothetical protein